MRSEKKHCVTHCHVLLYCSRIHLHFCLLRAFHIIERLFLVMGRKALAARCYRVQQSHSTVVDKVKSVSSLEASQAAGLLRSTPSSYHELGSRFSTASHFSVHFSMKKVTTRTLVHLVDAVRKWQHSRVYLNGFWRTGFRGCLLLVYNPLQVCPCTQRK